MYKGGAKGYRGGRRVVQGWYKWGVQGWCKGGAKGYKVYQGVLEGAGDGANVGTLEGAGDGVIVGGNVDGATLGADVGVGDGDGLGDCVQT